MAHNYYELLGVSKSATEDEIRKSYKQQALRWHPDKNPGSEEAAERFRNLSEAYQVLSDPVKRKQYNAYGSSTQFEFAPAEDIFKGFFQTMLDCGFFDFDDSTIQSLFEGPEVRIAFTTFSHFPPGNQVLNRVQDFARGTQLEPVLTKITNAARPRTRTKDISIKLHVDLQEIYARKLKKLSLRRIRKEANGQYEQHEKTLIVPVLSPVTIFKNAADELPDFHEAGDVIVSIEPKSDPVFHKHREHDLLIHKRVSPSELLTGCVFWFKHLSGETLKVTSRRPLWNQTIQVLRSEGLPVSRETSERGNLYIRFQCDDDVSDATAASLLALIPPIRDDGFMYACDSPPDCPEADLQVADEQEQSYIRADDVSD